jgi:hypothetical protein
MLATALVGVSPSPLTFDRPIGQLCNTDSTQEGEIRPVGCRLFHKFVSGTSIFFIYFSYNSLFDRCIQILGNPMVDIAHPFGSRNQLRSLVKRDGHMRNMAVGTVELGIPTEIVNAYQIKKNKPVT